MIDIPTLETPRLRLRPYRLDDFTDYARMWADPAVVRFIGGTPLSREAAWIRFLRQIGVWYHFGFGFFVVEDRTDGTFFGECGFHELRRAIVPSLEGTIECGWGLAAIAQGRGLAREAMEAALVWCDAHHPGRRQTCMISTGNTPSIAVATKLGFREFARSDHHGDPVILMERTAGGVTG
ncbi:N-acetyltransferase [Siculibacillus lacustris]|uniref:N-acetyltransferase n=1 Tax=Siculibacillus lacustris TaxID=1549641 RepID=A0A4Q9VT97_9HYPH|nr:GNAT family N-acetyltransferase [Siculibacillus lacustris]TBW39269.1 N-acetyltransferase [Siculibacillus lacustris]